MRAVVLADTHLRRDRPRRLPDAVYDELRHADAILHAGDVLHAGVLDELASYAPVSAVLGNNDRELVGVLPPTRIVELDGVRVGMVHDAGDRRGRPARLARRFPDCDLVVFGHSHQPVDEFGIGGQRLFNPGSPTERRMQPRHSYGVLDCRDGGLVSSRIVEI